MSVTSNEPATSPMITSIPDLVSFDLYRDIHKAIRAELFAVTHEAGVIDPADHPARRTHAARVHALADLLGHHAQHEDRNLDEVIARFAPTYVVEISGDHVELETAMQRIAALADAALASDDARAGSHALYLELAAFTGSYLLHQDVEERVVMRVLAEHLDVIELLQLHEQILASVAPEVMRRCLQLMLPAINIQDRAELLGGMRATAPVDVFASTWALAGEVLSTRDYVTTAARVGVAVDTTKIAGGRS